MTTFTRTKTGPTLDYPVAPYQYNLANSIFSHSIEQRVKLSYIVILCVTPRDRYQFCPVRARQTDAERTAPPLSAQGSTTSHVHEFPRK